MELNHENSVFGLTLFSSLKQSVDFAILPCAMHLNP